MHLREAVRDVLQVREVHGSDEWPAKCLSPDHNPRGTTASVNVVSGLWVCYSCGRGGRVEDVLSGVRIADPSPDDNLAVIEANLTAPDGPRRYPAAYLNLFKVEHSYWQSRFSADAIEEFSLGYDYEADRCTYPLRDEEGEVVGVVYRRLDGGEPKYLYPKGVKCHDLLFGWEKWRYTNKSVVLVEGAMDVVALWEAGVPALGIFGSRLSQRQARMIRMLNPNSVTCAFDMDAAGAAATYSVAISVVADCCPVYVASWPVEEAKDVAELSEARRRQVIEEAVDVDL